MGSSHLRLAVVDSVAGAYLVRKHLLAHSFEFGSLLEFHTLSEAVEHFRHHTTDLLYLNLDLPEFDHVHSLNDFDLDEETVLIATSTRSSVLERCRTGTHERLLKPFSAEALIDALSRAAQRFRECRIKSFLSLMSAYVETARTDSYHPPHTIALHTKDGLLLLDESEIEWIRARGNYVQVHRRIGEALNVRYTLAEVENLLDGARFRIIHRGSIVNLDLMKRLDQSPAGRSAVVMSSGAILPVSRRHRAPLVRAINGYARTAAPTESSTQL